ncbi:hypothetical protein WSS15_11960 [Acetobacter pasteurianus]|nr:hypothetical protein WSS15_11960 [Acetobacter pasteurianus]
MTEFYKMTRNCLKCEKSASMISQMKALEEENRRLKRMYADLSMQTDILKEALGKK